MIQHVIRYDVLYDRLTAAERKAIEDTFRKWIHYHLHEYWRGREKFFKEDKNETWDTRYSRVNWLPNMLYPRAQGIFLMALALQDEKLIRECFSTPVGGFKWWMDHYVADQHFYMEEFKKQDSVFGELLLWCRGCKRLGLDELGFGYVGEGDGPGHSAGATMEKYVEGWIKLGFPYAPAPKGGTPTIPCVYMGDAGLTEMVRGYKPGATQAHHRWSTRNMQGPSPRMGKPMWFEIAHAQWPDAGFDWVLAMARMPDQDKYYPSLFFNIDPADPKKVKPWAVKSYVAPERGFGMLRMEESRDYWTSDRPVACLQFGMQYVHYVHDCFTLMHYFSGRREVYGRRAFGPHTGYAGSHPWVDTVRGHNGIVVDGRQVKPVDDGENGAENTDIRHRFAPHMKFVAIHAKPKEVERRVHMYSHEKKAVTVALYPDCAVERALCLTDAYMLDVFNLVSDRDRVYHWNHHPSGIPQDGEDDKWKPTEDLNGGKLWSLEGSNMKGNHGKNIPAGKFDLPNPHKREMGKKPWELPVAYGKDKPGVIIRMLGGDSTTVYRDVGQGVTTTIAERRMPKTVFVVLHEPYKGKTRIEDFEEIQKNDSGVAVRVMGRKGSDVNDRIFLAYQGQSKEPITLGDKTDKLTFRGFAHVRVAGSDVLVVGDVKKMKLDVGRKAKKLILNGKETPADISKGTLILEAD